MKFNEPFTAHRTMTSSNWRGSWASSPLCCSLSLWRCRRLSVVAPHIATQWGAAAKASAPILPEVPALPDTTPLGHLLAIIGDPAASRALLDQFATAQGAAE